MQEGMLRLTGEERQPGMAGQAWSRRMSRGRLPLHSGRRGQTGSGTRLATEEQSLACFREVPFLEGSVTTRQGMRVQTQEPTGKHFTFEP